MAKTSFPLSKVYGLFEPGPVILLSTAGKTRPNVMTMSWQTMLDFEPPLIGCVISDRNHSFKLLQAAKDCVLNIPTAELAEQVVQCGNSSGARTDKFKKFKLTAVPAKRVSAPLIAECYASVECRVTDTGMVDAYAFFVLQAVKAWVDPQVTAPKTLHHLGYGRFMVAGGIIQTTSKMR